MKSSWKQNLPTLDLTPMMVSSPWMPKRWLLDVPNTINKGLAPFRAIWPRISVAVILCVLAYMLLIVIGTLFGGVWGSIFHHMNSLAVHPPGADAINYFPGSQECNILGSDIYLASSSNPKVSPFCETRAALLQAISSGGRHGFDEPYVGKGCTYRWFSTQEVCAILERFNAIIFVGDDIALAIYTAFNILLREDLVFGGVQMLHANDQVPTSCNCDNQFLNKDCAPYSVMSSERVKNSREILGNGNPYSCERIPHAYISVDSTPADPKAVALFNDLTRSNDNPWKPRPVIYSFGHGSSLDSKHAISALDEWHALNLASARNVPMLFISPPSMGSFRAETGLKNTKIWQFHEKMAAVAEQYHVDVLSLYNLTLQASSPDGLHFGERVALVEAMIMINWLSKLETS